MRAYIPSAGVFYKYRTVSTSHLQELQKDIDKLKDEGRLSKHAIYQSYLQELKFKVAEKLPDAKSLIIMAIPTRLLLVRFHLEGKVREATFPSNYSSDGLVEEEVQESVSQ